MYEAQPDLIGITPLEGRNKLASIGPLDPFGPLEPFTPFLYLLIAKALGMTKSKPTPSLSLMLIIGPYSAPIVVIISDCSDC